MELHIFIGRHWCLVSPRTCAWRRHTARLRRVHSSSSSSKSEIAWCFASSSTARMPAVCDFKFAAEDDGCPAGMARAPARQACFATSGAPCVPIRRPHAAAAPASLRVFHVEKTATTSLVKELEQCLPVRVRTDEGCWSGVNRETWAANLTAPSATSVLLRHPRAHLLSMYRHCRYSGWGRWRSASFPRNGTLVAGFAEWLDAELRERAPRVGRRRQGPVVDGLGLLPPAQPTDARDDVQERAAQTIATSRRCRCTWTGARTRRCTGTQLLAQAQFAGVTELYDVHLCLLLHAHSPRRDLLLSGCECGGGRAVHRRRVRIAHEWPVGPKRAPPAASTSSRRRSSPASTRSPAPTPTCTYALRRTIALARALEARVRQRLLCCAHLEPRAPSSAICQGQEAIDEALRDAPWVFSVSQNI